MRRLRTRESNRQPQGMPCAQHSTRRRVWLPEALAPSSYGSGQASLLPDMVYRKLFRAALPNAGESGETDFQAIFAVAE